MANGTRVNRVRQQETLKQNNREAVPMEEFRDHIEASAREIHKPKAIIPTSPGSFKFGETGLVLNDLGADFSAAKLSQQDFDDLGSILIGINDKFQLWIGDYLVAYEVGFDISYEQIVDHFEIPADRLQNYKWVADRVPISLRNEMLSYSHYYTVAGKDNLEDREHWIKMALRGDGIRIEDEDGKPRYHKNGDPMYKPWSVARLRREMNIERAKALGGKKYGHIVGYQRQVQLFNETLLPLADGTVDVVDEHFTQLRQFFNDANEALKMISRVQNANKNAGKK